MEGSRQESKFGTEGSEVMEQQGKTKIVVRSENADGYTFMELPRSSTELRLEPSSHLK